MRLGHHKNKDTMLLTPYEEKLWELKQQGNSYSKIAEIIGSKSSADVIGARVRNIKQKVEAANYEKLKIEDRKK